MGSRPLLLVRGAVLLLACLFLLSSGMNLGATVPFGIGRLSFSAPSSSIAEFEVAIGLALLAAFALSRPYVYAGALLFASVGILEGLLSSGVQGNARSLHELMIPFLAGWLALGVEAGRSYRSRSGRSACSRSLRCSPARTWSAFAGTAGTRPAACRASTSCCLAWEDGRA
ncbi:MAG TPA: hypothetical protein VLX56_09120 [Nitrososphaerales archaeon]|nr:hypothetical protein [Nitrososphaerales archaeon]